MYVSFGDRDSEILRMNPPPTTKTPKKASERPEKKAKMTMKSREMVADAKKVTLSPKGLIGVGDRKMSLLQDVNKLEKKLRHEKKVQGALKRAFTRPLGVLPRLPPCLPPNVLELVAEVAVLEEEVVRLEQQVVHIRQGLYQATVRASSSQWNMDDSAYLHALWSDEKAEVSVARSLLSVTEDRQRKENHSRDDSTKSNAQVLNHSVQVIITPTKRPPIISRKKLKIICGVVDHKSSPKVKTPGTPDGRVVSDHDGPNKLSESILRCLINIFVRKSSLKGRRTAEVLPSYDNYAEAELWDPYGICAGFEKKDVGPYKHLLAIEASSVNLNRTLNSLFLIHRMKLLLEKLATVDLKGLTHQEKLAFWINIYNSCMMNAILDHGIPDSPKMVLALMQQATINVSGHSLNAIAIEHDILRLPYHVKYETMSKGSKSDEMTTRSIFGLELSEPLVTFALCCGSWSSPAVRVYTAAKVENELEVAKREYLQAAVGFSTQKFVIPKLLDWYLLDFSKDLESLLDWVCLQLPNRLGKEAIRCLAEGKSKPLSQFVQVMPYEFRFRYLIQP